MCKKMKHIASMHTRRQGVTTFGMKKVGIRVKK